MGSFKLTITQKGNWDDLNKFLLAAKHIDAEHLMLDYGEKLVNELASSTPRDTGETAESWDYKVYNFQDGNNVLWVFNDSTTKRSNPNTNIPIPILLEYGHRTRFGGYVEPNDFMTTIIDKYAEEIADVFWSEVKRL